MTRREQEWPPVPGMAPEGRASAPPRAAASRAPLAIASLALVLSAVGWSPRDEIPDVPLAEIRIEGNHSIAEEKIRAKIVSRVGRPIDRRTVERERQSLLGTKWFSDVKASWKWVEEGNQAKGIVLIFEVIEMPLLTAVEFRGMTKLRLKTVEESTGLKVGNRADAVRARAAINQIRRMYEEKGYQMAEVQLLEGGKPGDTKVVIGVFEGPKVHIAHVGFEGNTFISDAVLRTKIRSKPRLLDLGGGFREDDVEEDRQKLMEYYQGLGFMEVKVTPMKRPDPKLGDLTLTFVISEGVRYQVRNLIFEGNQKISTEDLKKELVLHSGQPFLDSAREADLKSLMSKYYELGCSEVDILPAQRYTDEPGVIDILYKIDEGEIYQIGAINISGNERTKKKVILEQAIASGLLPGQTLNRNQIENLRSRLASLQYFHVDQQGGGKPIQITVSHPRPPDQPYAEASGTTFEDTVRGRFQSPEEPPIGGPAPAPLLPAEDFPSLPADVGEPPVMLPEAPPLAAPAAPLGAPMSPMVPVAPLAPGAGPVVPVVPVAPATTPLTPPIGSTEPVGTMPSLPGTGQTDVGPDRQEPFENRSFSAIAASVEPPPTRRSFADLDIQVDEAPTGRLMFGVGATSYGGLNGNLILHERNFDLFALPRSWSDITNGRAFRGAGQEFRLELQPGTLINRFIMSFREPYLYLFGTPYGLDVSGYGFNRIYPDWNERRGGARVSLGRPIGTMIYTDLAFRYENINFFGYKSPAPADYLAASGYTNLLTLRPSFRLDNRNNAITPTKGQYLEAAFEQGWGNFTFPKFTIEGRQHFTTGSRPDSSGKRILTLRGFYGVTGRDTPVYERFFAGDFRSMRGFMYRGVGPRILGSNVGGLSMMLGSVEYQFPLTANDRLQQVVFCDFGSVSPDYSITGWRCAVGTGIRLVIPQLSQLPLAFDLAFPVVKEDGDKVRHFNFFIGSFW